jgi:hypothetical protein
MNSAGIPAPPPGDQEPPDGWDLARRVTVLAARFDTVLPTLVTKTDLADLRTELLVKLEALRVDLIKWMAATLITILLSFVGLFVGLTRTFAMSPIVPHAATESPSDSARPGGIVRAPPSIPIK